MLGVNLDLEDGDTENQERRTKTPSKNISELASRKAVHFKNETSEQDKTLKLKRPTKKDIKTSNPATGRESITCRVCGNSVSRNNLVTHMKLNHSVDKAETTMSPSRDGAVEVKKEQVEEQANVNSFLAPFHSIIRCNFCTKTFNEKRGLRRHNQKLHPNEEATLKTGPFSCEFCNKIVTSRIKLRKHKNSKHSELASKGDTACQFCSKHFKNIQTHIKAMHTN